MRILIDFLHANSRTETSALKNAKGILSECIELAGEDIKSHFVAVSNIIRYLMQS